MNHDAILYARGLLRAHQAEQLTIQGQPFRTRSGHIERVCMWLERLLPQGGVEDAEALRLAAAFHDVGYIHGPQAHGAHSEPYLRQYAAERGIDQQAADRAAFLVREHSDKARWLTSPDAPRDLVLLMEADLLDEEGALGLVRDCMAAAALGAESYRDAYERMRMFEPSRLAHNPMATPQARAFWAQKQAVIQGFMQAFAFDLGACDEA